MNLGLSAPEPLAPQHNLDGFDSGVAGLDSWLRQIARQAAAANTSQTFVVADAENTVLGFYSLAAGSLLREEATSRAKRGAGKHPIPMALITRLAVTSSVQGRGLGVALLADAVARVQQVRNQIGIRLLAVHTLDESARTFYLKFGFEASPIAPNLLLLVL